MMVDRLRVGWHLSFSEMRATSDAILATRNRASPERRQRREWLADRAGGIDADG
jgi:hypothetical protein